MKIFLTELIKVVLRAVYWKSCQNHHTLSCTLARPSSGCQAGLHCFTGLKEYLSKWGALTHPLNDDRKFPQGKHKVFSVQKRFAARKCLSCGLNVWWYVKVECVSAYTRLSRLTPVADRCKVGFINVEGQVWSGRMANLFKMLLLPIPNERNLW